MTKEEFQRDLIRMWDSVRNKSKGEETCRDVNCRDCHFDEICNAAVYGSAIINACKTIEIVEQWAKEHPIKTNADKFKEVFSLDMAPQISSCINFKEKCADCKYYDYNDFKCDANKRFWNAEYNDKTKE